jgi:hypothetical protein
LQALAILRRLRQEKIDRPGAIRNTRVDDCDACSAGVYKAEKVRPEFGFRQHHQFRAQSPQVGPDGEGEIYWEIKNVPLPEALAGEFLPGVSGGRNHDLVLREGSTHLGDQASDR